jgi:hypothetical protein
LPRNVTKFVKLKAILCIVYNLELTSFFVMQLTFLEVGLANSQVSSLVTECGKKKSLRQSVGGCLASTVMAHSITSYLKKHVVENMNLEE